MQQPVYTWATYPRDPDRHYLNRDGQSVGSVTHDGPCGTWGNAIVGPDGNEVSSAEPMTFSAAKADALATAQALWDTPRRLACEDIARRLVAFGYPGVIAEDVETELALPADRRTVLGAMAAELLSDYPMEGK